MKRVFAWLAYTARRGVVRASAFRIASLAVGLGASIAVARLGGPEVKGIVAVYAASVAVSYLVLNFDLAQQGLRVARAQGRMDAVIPWLRNAWALYFAICTAIFLIGSFTRLATEWLAIGAFANLVSTQSAIAATGTRGPMVAAVGGLLQQASMLLGTLMLYAVGFLDADTVRGVIVASYLAPIPLFWRGSKVGSSRKGDGIGQRLADAARHGIGWQIIRSFQTLLLKLDILAVSTLMGTTAAGIYSVGVATAMLTNVVPQQVANSMLYQAMKSKAVHPQKSAVKALVAGGVTGSVIALAASWLVPAVYGEQYGEAVAVTWFALPGACAYGAVQVQSNYIRIFGTRKEFFNSNVYGLVALLVGIWAAIPRYGMRGAAAAFSCGLIVAAAAGARVSNQIHKRLSL